MTRVPEPPSAAQRHQCRVEWNDTAGPEGTARTIPALFAEQVRRRPEAVAVEHGRRRLSYAELDRASDRLAAALQRRGVGPEALVGLRLERGPELIAALVAIVKAGGAYVPLDPDYPAERLRFMIADSGAEVVIDESVLMELEEDAAAGERPAPVELAPENLAYVTYTSGSTGRPKGARIRHRAVARLVKGSTYASLGPDEVLFHLAPVSFDASTFEIWGALANGGRLVVAPPGVPSLQSLGTLLEERRVTTAWLTSALFQQVVELRLKSLAGLRQLLTGGDVVPPGHARKVLGELPWIRLVNGYGPTENTTFTCCHPMTRGEDVGSPISIGRPIGGTEVHVLDRRFRPVARGAQGELCAGGSGLARDYLGRPVLTAERFVPHPLAASPGARLYRVGDRARHLADGRLEFLGRLDRQVKIRGFRIEPGEVESRLVAHPAVCEAAVVARTDGPLGPRLVAYVVAEGAGECSTEELRRHLSDRLPSYMVPSAMVRLASLPWTPSGKVDRRALAALPPPETASGEAAPPEPAAPQTSTEEILAGIWAEVLGRERIGRGESFLELGGHSLVAVRTLSRVRELFGVELTAAALFRSPTVAALAELVDSEARGPRPSPPPLERARPGEPIPLAFGQERLWFLDRLAGPSALYNEPLLLEWRGPLSPAALSAACDRLLERHEVLRTRFPENEGEPRQVVEDAGGGVLRSIDLARLPDTRKRAEANREAFVLARRPFDLERGPVLAAALLRLSEDEHRLLLVQHHIVCDGWSVELLLGELAALYRAALTGRPASLPEPAFSFGDYALWQRRWLTETVLEPHLAYWRRRLAGAPPTLELPFDRPRPARPSRRGERIGRRLPALLRERLAELGRRREATLAMVALSAFLALLHRTTGQRDLVVGMPMAGRGRRELEPLLGFFVHTVALRAAVSAELGVPELLARVRDAALEADAHQDLPFERLVEELRPERDPGSTPLFHVVFNFLKGLSAEGDWPGLTTSVAWLHPGTAKFDLTLEMEDADPELVAWAEYSTDRFDRTTIEQLLRAHERLLADLAGAVLTEDGRARVGELALASAAERHQCLLEWTDVSGRPAGGVLERRLRPLPDGPGRSAPVERPAPRTATVELLAAIWAEVLGRERVAPEESFFLLGGHSLLAVRLLWRVREAFGIDVAVSTLFDLPTVAGLAAFLDEERAKEPLASAPPLERTSRDLPVPLSFGQERLWFLDRLTGASALYNVPLVLDFHGALSRPALASACDRLVERHEVLRTRFPEAAGKPRQVVGPAAGAVLAQVDLTRLAPARKPPEASRQTRVLARRPFDLARGPLLAAALLELSEGEHRLVLVQHHAICDGWSLELLLDELAALYRAARSGRPAPSPEPELTYADYTVWQRCWMTRAVFEPHLDYWRRRLEGAPPTLGLPFDRPRPARPSRRGERIGRRLPAAPRERLVELGRPRGATLFMVALSAFQALLHRFTGERDLVVGVPMAGRQRRELEPLLGFFVNTVPLRTAVPAELAWPELLGEVRRAALDADAHQELPLERLVEELHPERDAGGTPLFQVVFNFLTALRTEGDWPGLETAVEWAHPGTAKFDLTLEVEDRATELVAWAEYATDLFDRATIERFLRAYEQLLARVVEDPGRRIGELEPSSAAERHQCLVEWRTLVLDRRFRPVPMGVPGELAVSGTGPALGDLERPELAAGAFVPDSWSGEAGSRLYRTGDLVRFLPDGTLCVLGRVDRRAPPPESETGEAPVEDEEAPRTATEGRLAAIWAEVLERGEVGRRESFFDLGGHSLLAMLMLSRVQEVFAVDLEVGTVFERPTVAALAAEIDGARRDEGVPPPLVAGPPEAEPPLSFAQERFWFLDQMTEGTNTYSVPFAVMLEGPLQVAALERFFAELVARHDVLRASFPSAGGRPVQRLRRWRRPYLPLVDLEALAAPARDRELERRVTEEALRPFDLERGPLMRNGLVRLDRERHALLLSFHHIVADGWSVAVLIREANAAYRAFVEGRPSPLAPPPIQYRDYARWQRDWLQDEALAAEIGFWRGELGEEPPVLTLPGQRRATRGQPPVTAAATFSLPPETSARLRGLARRGEATLFMTGLAAWAALLGRYGSQRRVVVGTVAANRGRAELEGLIGCFVNTLALAVDLGEDPSFAELLARVRQATLSAYAHQELPFEKLVEAYNPDRGSPQPLFQAFFTLGGADLPALDLPELEVGFLGSEESGQLASKFDLGLAMTDSPAGLSVGLGYNAAVYPRQLAELMMEDLRRVLEAVAEDDKMRFSELPGPSDEQRRRLEGLETVAGEAAEVAEEMQVAERRGRLAQQLDKLPPALRERFCKRLRSARGGVRQAAGIPRREAAEPAPLSFAQERLWFIDRMSPGSTAYNVPFVVSLDGPLDVDGLGRAIAAVVRRHEVLRTVFELRDEAPVQIVRPAGGAPLPVVDLRALGARAAEEARRLAEEEAHCPFDLQSGRLLRYRLLLLPGGRGEADHRLLFNVHHIAFDGWSAGILTRELGQLYEAFAAGRPSPLPELAVQYADFAAWQRRRLSGKALEAEVAHWRDRLAGAPPVLELPADRPRPAVRSLRGASFEFRLPETVAPELRAIGRRQGTTPFMTLLAAFKTLLARSTGRTDVTVGTVVAGRDRLEIESLIGFFVNTLVLRSDLSGNPSFLDLLARVRERVLEAQAHQDLPFDKLVEELKPERSMAYSPLFQVMFGVERVAGESPEPEGSPFELAGLDTGTAKFDLTVVLSEGPRQLGGGVEYDRDLFDAATVRRLVTHFQTLLAGALADPGRRVGELALMTGGERAQALFEWSRPAGAQRDDLTVTLLFHEQARRTPEKLAAAGPAGGVSYAELRSRAGRLARRLPGPGRWVGLASEPGPDLLAGMLGILEAGDAFVPLDPRFPDERLALMIEECGIEVLVTDRRRSGILARLEQLPCPDRATASPTHSEPPADPDRLAYVIYTSGSTGLPKGVPIAHRELVPMLSWSRDCFGLGETTRALQTLSYAFDFGIFECLTTVAFGGTLHVPPPSDVGDPEATARYAAERRINVLHGTPSFILELAAAGARFPDLDVLHLGGEALAWEQVATLAAAVSEGCGIFNGYGPTEATVNSTIHRVGPAGAGGRPGVPIGRASSNHRIYVLDGAGRPVPAGVAGELWVGRSLTRGYHLRPRLTAEKLVPDPFGETAGERLYRTGDLVRWQATGDVEFLGRFDHQVKIRGFRIELGEIETVLRRHPAVGEAVVAARGEAAKRLVAYLVPRGTSPEPEVLRAHLCEQLPDHMVPSAFVALAELPLTGSGKVDVRALPEPTDGGPREGSDRPPRDATELALARIWRELLGGEALGVHDDFFALGGHSLLTLRLQRRIEKTWGRRLPVTSFFQAPTIARQAALLRREHAAVNGSLVALRETGSRTPIFCVHAAGGHVICYQALARSLGPEQPFYAFQSAGLEDGAEGPRSIEAMARAYLEEMRGLAPEGPYRLAGWSMGGLVALEMARRLAEDGQEVDRLVLLDTHLANGAEAPPPDEAELVASFALHLGLAPEHLLDPADLGERNPLAALLARARDLDVVPPDLTPEDVERLYRVFRRNVEAARAYTPRSYPGPALLVTAADRPADTADPAASWRPWIAGLESRSAPGNHFTMVEEPNVGSLAAHFAGFHSWGHLV